MKYSETVLYTYFSDNLNPLLDKNTKSSSGLVIILFLSDIYSSRRFLIFGKRGITLSLFLFPKTLITPELKSPVLKDIRERGSEEEGGGENLNGFLADCGKSFCYTELIRSCLKELTPTLFNLNTPLQIPDLNNLAFSRELDITKKELIEFFKLVARFAKGGRFPVHLEIKKIRKESKFCLEISAVNTNYCLLIGDEVKSSIDSLCEIVTHDKVNLGFKFQVNFYEKVERPFLDDGKIKSLFIGQKKDLVSQINKSRD